MNKLYTLLWYLPLFTLFIGHAQSCPETLGDAGSTTIVHFKVTPGECTSYPESISIAGSLFDKMNCAGSDLKYELVSGSPLNSDDTFSVEFGFGTCDYLNGELRRETLSIETFTGLDGLKVYPNPLMDGNSVHISTGTLITANIVMFDLTGKVTLTDSMENESNKLLNLSTLNNGVYLMQISTENATASRKVVVMK